MVGIYPEWDDVLLNLSHIGINSRINLLGITVVNIDVDLGASIKKRVEININHDIIYFKLH